MLPRQSYSLSSETTGRRLLKCLWFIATVFLLNRLLNQIMPKSRQQKEVTLSSLSDSLKSAKAAVFANFQGLTVAQADELRGLCRNEGVKVLVAKKTLLKRAFEANGLEADPKVFQGGVVSLFGTTDEVAPARIVNDFAKKNNIVTIFGGTLEGKFIDTNFVMSLATLPSKQQLLGQLVGTINAPVTGFVNVLAGNLRGLVSVLNNIKEAKA
jgi:large subunit ribosomal protein L10